MDVAPPPRAHESPPRAAHAPRKLLLAPFETALHHAGAGRFQWLLLCACGAVYAACAISTTTLSFVLPCAECDFSLNSDDKGKLNATTLLGMCVGSYLWGSLADARGRKWAIIGALLLDAAAALVSSFAFTFRFFLCCRFFSGFGIIGATGLIFPYFGDFLSLRQRDVMLCRLEVFWTLGTILLPGIAWGIIPQEIFRAGASDGTGFQYASWRSFVAVCGVPSLLVAAMLAYFPESPRYLLHAGRADSALAVLRDIYSVNTGRAPDTFPVESMLLEPEESEAGCGDATRGCPQTDDVTASTKITVSCTQRLGAIWRRKRVLFSEPYLSLLVLCCFVDFGLMCSYYTLMMWFPDLFERFAQYSGAQGAGVCEVSSTFSTKKKNMTERDCSGGVKPVVYVHTLIVALSCLPTSLSVGLTINKIGKKIMLVLMLMTSGLAALGLDLVHSSLQNLALSCVFEAIVSCTEAVLFCVICEIFPTPVAATATAVTVTCGRVGAIVGNLVFGKLIDDNCSVAIYMLGGLLISSGLLCLVLPKSTRPERHADACEAPPPAQPALPAPPSPPSPPD